MNKLQQLEAKIQEAVPDIMKVTTGCRLLLRGDGWWERGVMIRNQKLDNITTGKIEERTDDWEILGRPITLLDTKQCLEYNKCTDKDFLEVANLWKSPNSLSNQSQELIDKLYEKIKS